jgi:hypothetical protein
MAPTTSQAGYQSSAQANWRALHRFLTVCIRCNLCRPHAGYVHVGFGPGVGVITAIRDTAAYGHWAATINTSAGRY